MLKVLGKGSFGKVCFTSIKIENSKQCLRYFKPLKGYL
jgi:hypothetical protein